jgi:hypothetical protein
MRPRCAKFQVFSVVKAHLVSRSCRQRRDLVAKVLVECVNRIALASIQRVELGGARPTAVGAGVTEKEYWIGH